VNVPVVSKIVLDAQSWQSIYEATLTNQTERLTVVHSPAQPNEYRLTRSDVPECASPAPLARDRIWQPFAGSDFSLADLGLEFFHWPTQTLLQNEMRKSRACHVLESRPAVTNDYARVLSWIDVETAGLLRADAYDRDNKRVKEFEVSSFKKVGEDYQLQKMEIRHLKARSRTVLEFEVGGK
jgi:hypothetical protein